MSFRGAFFLLFSIFVSDEGSFERFGTLSPVSRGRFDSVSNSTASSVLWQVGGVDGVCSLVKVL